MSDLFQLTKKYREVDPNNDTFKIPGTGKYLCVNPTT